MRVAIPGQLSSYTRNRSPVEAHGSNLADVLADLDRQFPGIRFRIIDEQDQIRRHIRIFVNQTQAPSIDIGVGPKDEILIFGALSGG